MKLTDQQISEAIKSYESGLSFAKVGKLFGVSDVAIRGLLVRRGIQPRTISQSNRKIACNHDYFNEKLDERRAYWIGFILADGSIQQRSYGQTQRLSINLQIADIGHIEKFKSDIGSEHKITIIRKDGTDTGCQISISSPELSDSLIKYSVLPQKSANHKPTNLIPPHLLRHYFRGYFDGNGGISRSNRSRWAINCCAGRDFLAHFVDWLNGQVGGSRARISFSDGTHRVSWSGTHRCREILSAMYENSGVYLDRKMALYEEISQDAKSSTRGPYNRK